MTNTDLVSALHAVINKATMTIETSVAAAGASSEPIEPSRQPRLGWGCLVLGGGPVPKLQTCGKVGPRGSVLSDPCMGRY